MKLLEKEYQGYTSHYEAIFVFLTYQNREGTRKRPSVYPSQTKVRPST
ncbi:hypothetical protein [Enterococcus ratti]|uniref:Uncharacterized protein n=1 Tax=Enterococcus ratti TaxID=150033 RepID=A0A1L8W7L7_9ENTE|nr:hypothetical protein [Enterococcus ratti]OJG77028.1 hypothetical protein RV14_GL001752 [Enterococcus ratti]